MSTEKKTGDEYLFEISSFLLTSAKGCLREPKLYGPLRLLTAFQRLALLPDYVPSLKRDKFLLEISDEIEKIISLTMTDQEAFEKAINELSVKLGREIKNRKLRK